MTINDDRNGLPGKVEHQWNLSNLPQYGHGCCLLDIAKEPQGIKIEKGKMYWIVAKTDSTNANADNTWEYTWRDQISHDVAVKSGPGGWALLQGFEAAYAVYGTKP